MTCTYPVIWAFKCHKMLKKHHFTEKANQFRYVIPHCAVLAKRKSFNCPLGHVSVTVSDGGDDNASGGRMVREKPRRREETDTCSLSAVVNSTRSTQSALLSSGWWPLPPLLTPRISLYDDVITMATAVWPFLGRQTSNVRWRLCKSHFTGKEKWFHSHHLFSFGQNNWYFHVSHD